jgi:triacylglycerol esterase/lipase EstA (alpha/beta hydrolase family)
MTRHTLQRSVLAGALGIGVLLSAAIAPAACAASEPTAAVPPRSSAPPAIGTVEINSYLAALAAKPRRANSANRPIYLVHGYSVNGRGWDCEGYWGPAKRALRAAGWRGPIVTFGYYSNDRNCDVRFNGTRDNSINSIGGALAKAIYSRDTRHGRSVDIIAHSMGGLVARSALAGTEQRWGASFPKRLYVEDVVTISTPHGGVPLIGFCSKNIKQCAEMKIRSKYLKMIAKYPSPQSSIGTDWTLIGADNDIVVPAWSATDMPAGHLVVFYKNKKTPVNHQSIHKITSGSFKVRYRNHTDKKWHTVANGASPVQTAKNAVYYWSKW